MNNDLEFRTARIRKLISSLQNKTKIQKEVLGFIVYGSFSDASDHQPTLYSDVDLEIVVKDEELKKFVDGFRFWFENNFEPVLIETSVGHLEKIFITKDFVDLQFKITPLSDFDGIDKRELNYFPSGYTIAFDKSGLLKEKIRASLKPAEEIPIGEKINKFNSKFWYFILGIPPYFERKE